jgi:hypothetical protein
MYQQFIRNNPVLTSIILFLVIFILIILGKPGFIFNNDGSLRQFGVGYRNKTILPVWLLAIILGILCYVFVLYSIVHPKLF